MCRSLKDGFVWGVEVMIRGLSGADRALALRVLSCFYLVAFAISALPAHEGAYHLSPSPTTHYRHHSKKDNSIYFYDRERFLRSGWNLLPVLCLTYSFRYFKKTLLKQTKQKRTHKIKPFIKTESECFLNVKRSFEILVCVFNCQLSSTNWERPSFVWMWQIS